MIKVGNTVVRKINYINSSGATINLPIVTNTDNSRGTDLIFVDSNNYISQYDHFFGQWASHGFSQSLFFGSAIGRESGLVTGIQIQLSGVTANHILGANVALSGGADIFLNDAYRSIGYTFVCANNVIQLTPFLGNIDISQRLNIGSKIAFVFDNNTTVNMYLVINCNNENMTEWYTYGWATYTNGAQQRTAQFLYPSDYGYKKINHRFCSSDVATIQNVNNHIVPFITGLTFTGAVPDSTVVTASQYPTSCVYDPDTRERFDPTKTIPGVQMSIPSYLSDDRQP